LEVLGAGAGVAVVGVVGVTAGAVVAPGDAGGALTAGLLAAADALAGWKVAVRFTSLDAATRASTAPAATSATTPPTIATGTRHSGASWITVLAVPHSRHHS
jgi:hypothetical protein